MHTALCKKFKYKYAFQKKLPKNVEGSSGFCVAEVCGNCWFSHFEWNERNDQLVIIVELILNNLEISILNYHNLNSLKQLIFPSSAQRILKFILCIIEHNKPAFLAAYLCYHIKRLLAYCDSISNMAHEKMQSVYSNHARDITFKNKFPLTMELLQNKWI